MIDCKITRTKSTNQKMSACTKIKKDITLDMKHIDHTHRSQTPAPSTPTHTPVATANPKPCHNRKRVTRQSEQASSGHITHRTTDKTLQSITAHCTALSSRHWHLVERPAEEGGRKGVGRDFSASPLFSPVPSSSPL